MMTTTNPFVPEATSFELGFILHQATGFIERERKNLKFINQKKIKMIRMGFSSRADGSLIS